MSEAKKPVLEVRNLSVTLPKGADREFAVDKVSFTVNRARSSAWWANRARASR
jgi:hypothetical protein